MFNGTPFQKFRIASLIIRFFKNTVKNLRLPPISSFVIRRSLFVVRRSEYQDQ
jgi:hypothetical protein